MTPSISFKTISEQYFATYLDEAKYKWDYEPQIPGHTKKPDFQISHHCVELLSDVKQRSPTEFVMGARHVDPIAGIRKLIEKGREKFKSFHDRMCVLVVYNAGDSATWLDPQRIFEAMLGDGGFTLAFSSETGTADPATVQNVFLPFGGKMIKHYSTMEPHSSTQNISAIIALKAYRIPNPNYEMAASEIAERRATDLGRPLTVEERCTVRHELILGGMPATIGETFGLTVCDNPYAKHPLPSSIFDSPFDERWSLLDGTLARVFVGERRLSLEESADHTET